MSYLMQEQENKLSLIKSGKWYDFPEIYNLFSFSEDKGEKCIGYVLDYIKKNDLKIKNPVDLGSGTGKIYDQLIKETNYNGDVYLVEVNHNMIQYLIKKYGNEVKVLKSKIAEFQLKEEKSNFIISSFGFPSSLFDQENCIRELKNVYQNLTDDGIFITIGWNEKWDDELSLMWKNYVWDNSTRRINRVRNCNLKWYINDIKTSIRFDDFKQRDFVLHTLFGEKAKEDFANSKQLEWSMHMGITIHTKKQLKTILKGLEKENEGN